MKRLLIAATLSFILFTKMYAQMDDDNTYAEINKPCPSFSLTDVNYYKVDHLSLNELKGKPFILDFFTQSCKACFQSFTKLNELSNKHNKKLDIFLIGLNDRAYNAHIKKAYERYKDKYALSLPIAYDSVLWKRLGAQFAGFPFLVWVNEKGVIKAITATEDLTEKNIESFLNGKDFPFLDKSAMAVKQRETIVGDTGDQENTGTEKIGEQLFKSQIGYWNRTDNFYFPSSIQNCYNEKKELVLKGCKLVDLFMLAYVNHGTYISFWQDSLLYQKLYSMPILKIKDSSVFRDNNIAGKLYNYYLRLPLNRFKYPLDKSDIITLQEIMQADLKLCFGFTAKIETREMPCYELIVIEGSKFKLKSDGISPPSIPGVPPGMTKYSPTGFAVKNEPVSTLLGMIWSYHPREGPFFDKTGIYDKIDFDLDAIMDDINDINKALNKQGLNLVKRTRMMNVLVISDSENK